MALRAACRSFRAHIYQHLANNSIMHHKCKMSTATSANPSPPAEPTAAKATALDLANSTFSELHLSKLDDWYTVRNQSLPREFALVVKRDYGNSLAKALLSIYSDHVWLEWKFLRVPRGFWKRRENRRRFFDWLLLSRFPWLNLNPGSDEEKRRLMGILYSITKEEIYTAGGAGMLLHVYMDSVVDAIQDIYEEKLDLKPWQFSKVPSNYWDSKRNRRAFLLEIGPRLGVRTPSDWYSVTTKAVFDIGGRGLLSNKYKNSLVLALLDLFPEHAWQPWKFRRVPAEWWRSIRNQRALFDAIATDLSIKDKEEWYNASPTEITRRAASVVALHGSVEAALMAIYCDHRFESWKFVRTSIR